MFPKLPCIQRLRRIRGIQARNLAGRTMEVKMNSEGVPPEERREEKKSWTRGGRFLWFPRGHLACFPEHDGPVEPASRRRLRGELVPLAEREARRGFAHPPVVA